MVVYGPQYRFRESAEQDARLPRMRAQKAEVWACYRTKDTILTVGEPCAGAWIGPPDASLRQWHCRCGAQRPEQCVTETAEKSKAVKLVYNKTTKRIDKVRTGDGLVLESFEPPIDE